MKALPAVLLLLATLGPLCLVWIPMKPPGYTEVMPPVVLI